MKLILKIIILIIGLNIFITTLFIMLKDEIYEPESALEEISIIKKYRIN
tara:strand:+ start:780 stop:926 length:147 start_codon:yes stop_codon:yes gene_type:complete